MRTIKFIRNFIAPDATIEVYNVSDDERLYFGQARLTPATRTAGTSVDTISPSDGESYLILYVKNYEDE